MQPTSLSIIVLTYHEELHLARCLESVKSVAGEIVVVDSFSTDGTREIAESYGAKFVQHEFVNQAQQFNWALDNLPISGEWILRLDADEYITPELAREIKETISINQPENQRESAHAVNGYYIKRRVYFLERWIKHGGYYPIWILRLFRKGKARSEEREMDEHIEVFEGRVEKLDYDFVDDNKKGLALWTAKHNDYSTREVFSRLRERSSGPQGGESGRRPFRSGIFSILPPLWRAFCYFSYRYILRLGFLDGKEGLIFHVLQGFWYRFLVDAKLYESRIKKI